MNVKITTANCEVVNSGLVTSFNGEPISLTLNSSPTPFKLTFKFLTDKSTEGQKMDAETPNTHEVILKLTNFKNPLGTGTARPVEFATNGDGKKLFINFYVYVVGDSSQTLQYTIYKEM